MKATRKLVSVLGMCLMVLAGTASQALAVGCPFGGTLGELGPNESLAELLQFEDMWVDVVGFVGDSSLDLVGVSIQDLDGRAIFRLGGVADCTARPPVDINVLRGNTRFDDAIIRCGFASVPDSLVYTIAITNIDPDRIPDECRNF